MSDLISRDEAIDAMANALWHYPNDGYRNLNEYKFARGLAEFGLKSVPSAQTDVPDRQDIIDALMVEFKRSPTIAIRAKDMIEQLPSVQPERKKGKWIQNDNGTYSCSLCQSWIPKEQHYYARFCLYCGADMRGEHDENI